MATFFVAPTLHKKVHYLDISPPKVVYCIRGFDRRDAPFEFSTRTLSSEEYKEAVTTGVAIAETEKEYAAGGVLLDARKGPSLYGEDTIF